MNQFTLTIYFTLIRQNKKVRKMSSSQTERIIYYFEAQNVRWLAPYLQPGHTIVQGVKEKNDLAAYYGNMGCGISSSGNTKFGKFLPKILYFLKCINAKAWKIRKCESMIFLITQSWTNLLKIGTTNSSKSVHLLANI